MSYQHFIDKTITHWEHANLLDQGALERSFAIFCSNILRFRPHTSIAVLPELYKSLMVRIALTSHDQGLRDPESCFAISGLDFFKKPDLKRHPGIIATFHTGSYRLLGRLFGYHKIPLCLVVSDAVYKEQRTSLIHDFYLGDESRKTPFSVINAEQPGSLSRMKSKLNAGSNLLIYLDGNVGQQKEIKAASGIPISFMDSRLWVRAGVAGLSLHTGAPIYSMVCTRSNWNEVHIQKPLILKPEAGENKVRYSHRVMADLYNELAKILVHRPSEWEGWLYLLPVDQSDQNDPLFPNYQTPNSRFFPFRLHGKYYAMESPGLCTYAIEKPQYQDLRTSLKQVWNL